MTNLARAWRAARPAVAGLQFDSAACSRQSFAAIEAAAAHARGEAEMGGYVAAQRAEPELTAGRRAVGELTGMTADDIVFTTGAANALDVLLRSWPEPRRVIVCLPGEYGPNLAVMAANGFGVLALPVDGLGRARVEDFASMIAADAPTAFTRLLAGAVSLSFFTYAFVNMGMVSGILPVVGVPLPFVSYGGTAMVTLGLGLGILMSVARSRRLMQS